MVKMDGFLCFSLRLIAISRLIENWHILVDFVHPNSRAPVTPAHAENLFVKEGVDGGCVCLFA